MTEKKENSIKEYLVIIVITIVSLLFVIGAWWYARYTLIGLEDRGTYGDMFGGVNALFSGLAFAGIIVTILLQSKELKLQRDELRDTRAEFEMQNQTMKLQRFENTFFQMVDLHHKIVDSMQVVISDNDRREFYFNRDNNEVAGRDVLNFYCRKLLFEYKRDKTKNSFLDTYKFFYSGYKKDLGHYFRNLYRIIKLVHESDLTNENATKKEKYEAKYKYSSIIRAQLSDDEKILLYYNCHSHHGKKFRPLINQYSLLKGVNHAVLPFIEARNSYENEAFSNPKSKIPELA